MMINEPQNAFIYIECIIYNVFLKYITICWINYRSKKKESFLYLCNIITELLLMWVTIGAVVALFLCT